jgi:hypothetical protein
MLRAVIALLVLLCAAPASAETIHVAAGGNLQTALDNAVRGDVITLEAGATFSSATGFTLPAKTGTGTITVRTVTADGSLPAKVNPTTYAANPALFAVIQSTHNAFPVITGDSNDDGWTFIGVVFEMSNATTTAVGDALRFGVSISSADDLPTNITFDRVVIRAASGGTALRGCQCQIRNLVFKNSWITNVRSMAAESHSLSAWNSPGPFLIENNYIEAADIGVLFGGANPAISGLIPSDITFRWNYVTRPAAQHNSTDYAVKNLFELKNAQRVHIYGNIFEHNWPDGQSGYSIVFTVRANGPSAAWTTIRDVMFERNILRNAAAGFNILGLDTQTSGCEGSPGGVCPSERMQRVTIRNNLIYGIDKTVWNNPNGSSANGVMFQIAAAPEYLTIEYNTLMGAGSETGNIIAFASSALGNALPGFTFRRNIVQKAATGSSGVVGDGLGEGNATLAVYGANTSGFPNTVFTENVLAGCTAATYNNWSGNLFPALATLWADFTNIGAANFRLVGGSAYTGYGMNQDEIEAAINGGSVDTPNWGGGGGSTVIKRFRRLRIRI